MLDQRKERVQHLGCKRDGFAMTKQQPLAHVQQERAELK
jgi:hypothetical protein